MLDEVIREVDEASQSRVRTSLSIVEQKCMAFWYRCGQQGGRLDKRPNAARQGHGELVYEEFKHLMDLLILREGFTSSEYDQFMEMFAAWL